MDRFLELDRSAPLREVWYYAVPGPRLRRGRILPKTILGEPLLLGRDRDGAAFALRDICPHRGMPLTRGAFDGQTIECCYHGWRFDTAGRCVAIPSLVADQAFEPGRIKVARYPVREIQGNVWVFFGSDPADAPEPPVLPEIGERGPAILETVRLDAAIDHAVVGLMDPAHGPFVHTAWWWRSRRSMHEKAKAFEPSPFGFTMLRHAPSTNSNAYRILGGRPETEISFRLPGVRVEHIRIGRYVVCNLTALTPLDERTTEITTALYWTMPWLTALKPLLRPFVRTFLGQDRDVMSMQQVGLAFRPTLMLIDDADTQAKWYHRLKDEYARARAERRPFVNPVKPRVLRWRS
ncbi:MAG TPA: aromatic ring-hydroxylating dioxygenase subunit alpha [Candidatus Sulfotelmatobacter sp.]|nr:aromatic ring-hydroxylating dioxygenase subunit alpha [Candidatus Sulfotelmatobacter sp.]